MHIIIFIRDFFLFVFSSYYFYNLIILYIHPFKIKNIIIFIYYDMLHVIYYLYCSSSRLTSRNLQ